VHDQHNMSREQAKAQGLHCVSINLTGVQRSADIVGRSFSQDSLRRKIIMHDLPQGCGGAVG
jgi:hypothetical protein